MMVLVLAVGTRAADALRLRQEEIILGKLSVADAHDYYEELRRRARRVRIMRAVTLASLILALLAARRRMIDPPSTSRTAGETQRPSPPTNTEAARALADAELARHAARGTVDPTRFEAGRVTGDDRHPWIFDYLPRQGSGEKLRIYVDRAGRTELHRLP